MWTASHGAAPSDSDDAPAKGTGNAEDKPKIVLLSAIVHLVNSDAQMKRLTSGAVACLAIVVALARRQLKKDRGFRLGLCRAPAKDCRPGQTWLGLALFLSGNSILVSSP